MSDYKAFLKRFGAVVRTFRLAANKSQHDIAVAIGCTQSYISRLEQGLHGFDSKTLFDLSRALDTPLDRLFSAARKEKV